MSVIFEKYGLFIMLSGRLYSENVAVAIDLFSLGCEIPSNIPHGWYLKSIKDDSRFTFEGS